MRFNLSRLVGGGAAILARHGTVVVCVASLALNLMQAQKLRALSPTQRVRPEIGTRMPPMSLVDSRGRSVVVRYDDGALPTILYYFSPSCRWCRDNWPGVIELERETRGRYRLVAISTARDLGQVQAEHRLPFAVYGGLADRLRRSAGLAGTPHMIVLSPSGHVLNAWVGAFTDRTRADVEKYFRFELPEFVPRSVASPGD